MFSQIKSIVLYMSKLNPFILKYSFPCECASCHTQKLQLDFLQWLPFAVLKHLHFVNTKQPPPLRAFQTCTLLSQRELLTNFKYFILDQPPITLLWNRSYRCNQLMDRVVLFWLKGCLRWTQIFFVCNLKMKTECSHSEPRAHCGLWQLLKICKWESLLPRNSRRISSQLLGHATKALFLFVYRFSWKKCQLNVLTSLEENQDGNITSKPCCKHLHYRQPLRNRTGGENELNVIRGNVFSDHLRGHGVDPWLFVSW